MQQQRSPPSSSRPNYPTQLSSLAAAISEGPTINAAAIKTIQRASPTHRSAPSSTKQHTGGQPPRLQENKARRLRVVLAENPPDSTGYSQYEPGI
mmetsp:Transcript_36717/g.82600  ORF Transcript_36717/g.82600 Transcript_36717/m.82600 type:complete len:95 (-) Transcript_36717:768-1052(-)